MPSSRIISSDNHVIEPAELWAARVDSKFKERAPRVVYREDPGGDINGDWWFCDGIKVMSPTMGTLAGVRFEEPERINLKGRMEDVILGGYIPEEHVKDLDVDGIDVSILYPTVGLLLYSVPDSELVSSVFCTYNDWLAEFCKPFPNRLKGIAMINLDHVPSGVKELERCAKMGLPGAMISVYPPEAHSYDNPEYEPLWAAAQDLDIPLSLHVGTMRPNPGQVIDFETTSATQFSNNDHWVRMSIGNMIFSGVFERYPKLQVGTIEHELAWIPYFLDRIDYNYTQRQSEVAPYRFKGDTLPSDFFHNNVFVSFQEDAMGIRDRHIIGLDQLLWASDYPHPESTFPRSKEIIEEILVDCTEEEIEMIVCGNSARTYRC